MLINVTYFHTHSATYILVLLRKRKRGIRLYIVIVGKVKKLHIFPKPDQNVYSLHELSTCSLSIREV